MFLLSNYGGYGRGHFELPDVWHVPNQHSSHISVLLIYDLIVRRLLIGRNHNIHIRAFVKMAAAVRLAEFIFEIWKIFSNINGPVI